MRDMLNANGAGEGSPPRHHVNLLAERAVRFRMSKREFLPHEAMVEPEPLIDSVVEYLLFLKARSEEPQFEALMASYPTLHKDWFSAEEEEAWKDYQ